MNENDFEGTLILEKLASGGKVEDFYDAVDLDDFERARSLMHLAGIEAVSIAAVLKKMSEANGEL